MRTNPLKAKLRAGERVAGVLLTIQDPDLVEMVGHLGFDFVFLDAQHGGIGLEKTRELIRAADVTGLTPLVRVPRDDPSVMLHYLEMGAGGIIVPNVMSRAQAVAAVRAIKYAPLGTRGAMGASRAAAYGVTGAADYPRRANEETMLLPILEDREALDDLPGIVGVEGVDAILIGPGDLALSMGIPGGWTDPRVQAEVDRIHAAARAAGKGAIIVALDIQDARRLREQGYQGLMVLTSTLITGAAREFLAAMRGA